MFDIKKAKEEAQKEISEERLGEAKSKYKSKLREIARAKKIVANLERELEELDLELSEGN